MRPTRSRWRTGSLWPFSRKALCGVLLCLCAVIILRNYLPVPSLLLESAVNTQGEHPLPEVPIMILDNKKGLTNQRSYALSGLHLARILGWAVMMPSIVSPIDCNHDTTCYQYSRFQPVNFSQIYDFDHFVKEAAELGITVFQELPEGYIALPHELWPCVTHGRCRDTFDGLVDKYGKISGKYTVAAPGIAASVIDSRKTAESVIATNRVFQHASDIQDDAKTIYEELHGKGTVVAIHFRFEPDAKKVNYAGDMVLFSERLIHCLMHFQHAERPLVLYLVTAMDIQEAKLTLAMQRVLDVFPTVVFASKRTCQSTLRTAESTITFTKAALDFEVSMRADYFVWFVQSSFSSFIALGRNTILLRATRPHTIMMPPLNMAAICNLEKTHIWQFELQLPFNDCFVNDPCALLMRLSAHPDSRRTCTIPEYPAEVASCTGLTAWASHCKKGSTVDILMINSSKFHPISSEYESFYNYTIEQAF